MPNIQRFGGGGTNPLNTVYISGLAQGYYSLTCTIPVGKVNKVYIKKLHLTNVSNPYCNIIGDNNTVIDSKSVSGWTDIDINERSVNTSGHASVTIKFGSNGGVGANFASGNNFIQYNT